MTCNESSRLSEKTESLRLRNESVKPRSCIIGAPYANSTKSTNRRNVLAPKGRQDYKCVLLVSDRAVPEKCSDSGISRNSSMLACIESQLHSLPEPHARKGGSEFYESERRRRTYLSHTVSQDYRQLTGSSVILSDYGSSVKLCRSCNTYYEESFSNSGTAEPSVPYKDLDVPTKLSNVFWKLKLTLNPFKCGDELINFDSLWPNDNCLGDLLVETCSVSSSFVQLLTNFVCLCGPLHLLQTLISRSVVGVNHTFETGFTLLHVACIAQNLDVVKFLIKSGSDSTIRDSQGHTAAQVSRMPQICSLLPGAAVVSKFRRLLPTLLEKQKIFEMARSAAETEKLLIQLQNLEFDVNSEMDNAGDLLFHVAVKEGLSQLPLLLLLVKLFKVDINRPNRSGFTCLMLAASVGIEVLVDVLMCVFGANPDSCCHENQWTALHFACYEQHLAVVNVLLKRGANVNLEDVNGARADDIARRYGADDCCQVIERRRREYNETVEAAIIQNKHDKIRNLSADDLSVISESGLTLIMLAVKQSNDQVLELILHRAKNVQTDQERQNEKQEHPTLINAQQPKTLQTALAFSTLCGNRKAVELLMRFGANPSISDIQNLLPLHHAVIKGDVEIIKTLLQHNVALTGLQKAIELTQNEEILAHLKAASNWRQDAIVYPELFEHSVSGNVNRLFCILEKGDYVNPLSSVGDWPLYLAALNGHLDVIKLLLKHGGDFQSIHSLNGNALLHIACANNHEEIVKYLVTKYQESDKTSSLLIDHLNRFNFDARTPLMLAAEAGNLSLISLLLDNGASTSVLTPSGEIFRCDRFAGVQHLLEQRLKLHSAEVFGALANNKNCLKHLSSVFLPFHDHNLRDPITGDSPLMTAARLGKIDVLAFLLKSSSYSLFNTVGRLDILPHKLVAVLPSSDDDVDQHHHHTVGKKAVLDDENKDVSDDNLYSRQMKDKLSTVHQHLNFICQQNPVLFGNKVSQTCGINFLDRSTVYHRVVEHGDSAAMLECLLEADQSAINMQDARGFSPLHLAFQLNRKKIIRRLMTLPCVDVNSRTLDGELPEDLTSSAALKSLVIGARNQQLTTSFPQCLLRSVAESISRASQSDMSQSISYISEPVNFERLNARFATFKENYHSAQM